jgi:hypothetical protein
VVLAVLAVQLAVTVVSAKVITKRLRQARAEASDRLVVLVELTQGRVAQAVTLVLVAQVAHGQLLALAVRQA